MRRYRLFSGSIAVLAVLLASACFTSDKPLLMQSEYVQPIGSGLWESVEPVPDDDWTRMSEVEKTAHHCRTVEKQHVCAERVQITAEADKTYRLQWQDEADKETLQFAALSPGSFIVQQVVDDRAVQYALATTTSPDQFTMNAPKCDRDTYLHVFAPPRESGSNDCRVPDRERLGKLFAKYLKRASPADARLYRRIAD